MTNKEDLHMSKISYDDHCIASCVEYPDVIVFAKSDKELKKNFEDGVQIYLQAMKDNHLPIQKREVLSIATKMD